VNTLAPHVYHRYRALGPADRGLVREAALLLVVARVGIAVLPVPHLRKLLDGKWGRPRAPVERVGWAVTAAARRLPFRTTCLVDSLAADAMLRRRGYASEVRFGVRVPDGNELAAHAWVEHDGKVVFGSIPDLAEYAVLSDSASNARCMHRNAQVGR
jgi:hypothetical protein